MILQRQAGTRVRLANGDRLFFVQLYRWFPSILKVITIMSPENRSGGIGRAFAGTDGASHAHGPDDRRRC
jgi:hypothetical protein